jgi:hypothetical protein
MWTKLIKNGAQYSYFVMWFTFLCLTFNMLVMSWILALKQRKDTCNFLFWMVLHTQPLVGEWKYSSIMEVCIILHYSWSCVALISVFLSLSVGKIINYCCRPNMLGIKKWPRLKCSNKGGWLQMHCSRECDHLSIIQAASLSWSACLYMETLHN